MEPGLQKGSVVMGSPKKGYSFAGATLCNGGKEEPPFLIKRRNKTFSACLAQLVRASVSYAECHQFKSSNRHPQNRKKE